MFLPGGRELALQHHVGLSEGGSHVAPVDRHVDQHVGPVRAKPIVDQRRVRGHRGAWVGDRRQVFVVDGDQRCCLRRCRLGFSHHERHPVALEAHHVPTQDRLVGVDQAVGVVGHIGGGEHSHHAGMAQRRARVDAADAGVRALRKDDLGVQHAGPHQVGRIGRRPGHFPDRIGTLQRGSEQRPHGAPPAASTASRILR